MVVVRILILFISFIFVASTYACNLNKPYVVGVEAIDYSPHYNFVEAGQPSFFAEFINWLTVKTGCQFIVKALPIKRLNIAYERTGSIDFIYPDNPNWHLSNDKTLREFSVGITTAISGTMVKKAHENIGITEFNNLAFPRGFSPIAWYPFKAQHDIKFTETSNALSALQMVITDRVDGADIEYNVAKHLIDKHQLPPLVLAKNLPNTPTQFHLSTIKHVEFLKEISELVSLNSNEIAELQSKVGLIDKTY